MTNGEAQRSLHLPCKTAIRSFQSGVCIGFGERAPVLKWCGENPFKPEFVYGAQQGNTLYLNPDCVTPDNGPLTGDDAIHVATHTIAHEPCHYINGDKISATARYFMGEWRCKDVGQKAETKHMFSQKEGFDWAEFLVTGDAYPDIVEAFKGQGPHPSMHPNGNQHFWQKFAASARESQAIVRFIAGITEDDRPNLTPEMVLHPPKPLSDSKPAPLPVKMSPDDPNIIDNVPPARPQP